MFELFGILGFYLFFMIWMISLSHLQLINRIYSNQISQKSIGIFLGNLRFPVSLIYGGLIGQFADIESNPKELWDSAQKIEDSSDRGRKQALFMLLALMFVCLGLPLLLFLVGTIYSNKLSHRIIFGAGILLPVITIFLLRPWRFGSSLSDIEEGLAQARDL